MLSRYLESLSANNNRTVRSRDDSLNSSDGEFEMSGHDQQPRPTPRRHKTNLISLEQRLNKIQVQFGFIYLFIYFAFFADCFFCIFAQCH
jgi:Leucine-rich repeat (LRR) protein